MDTGRKEKFSSHAQLLGKDTNQWDDVQLSLNKGIISAILKKSVTAVSFNLRSGNVVFYFGKGFAGSPSKYLHSVASQHGSELDSLFALVDTSSNLCGVFKGADSSVATAWFDAYEDAAWDKPGMHPSGRRELSKFLKYD